MRSEFEADVHALLSENGWYENDGYRETSDPMRGFAIGLTAGQVIDELLRREAAKKAGEE